MTSDLLTEIVGRAGVITLNRPQALNAITHDMVRAIARALHDWANDAKVHRVVIRQSGERAFSAGGDIRHLYDGIKAGRFAEVLAFYREEYRLNAVIKRYPKPYIALIDGIVMGGGVGVSLHGSHRVGSEKLAFAMPEVGIGFFPDVGATYALPRLPGRTGLFLALTGERVGIADALWAGLVTHHVPRAAFPALFDALIATDDVAATLARFATEPGPAALAARDKALDRLLGQARLDAVLDAVEAAATRDDAAAIALRETLATRSPTSVAIAFRQMREGARLDFEGCMRLEFRIVNRIVHGPDFVEGVRAVIVDKDNAPRWWPARFGELDEAAIDAHFAPLPEGELDFD